MRTVYFLTHPETVIVAEVPVPEWGLSERGRQRAREAGARLSNIGSIWTSTETKAAEAATVFGEVLGLSAILVADLREVDRSSTGYLPEPDFWATYDAFLARPSHSARGWETAIDAQRRAVAALDLVLADERSQLADVALVAHGGVGALVRCHLLGTPIQRLVDQPGPGSYFSFEASGDGNGKATGWRSFEQLAEP